MKNEEINTNMGSSSTFKKAAGEWNIAIIEGDGIGPEVTKQSVNVLNAIADKFGHHFNFTNCLMGAVAIDTTGNPLPDETIEVCLNSHAILFGAIGHPKYDNDPAAKVRPEQGLLKLRKSLPDNTSRYGC